MSLKAHVALSVATLVLGGVAKGEVSTDGLTLLPAKCINTDLQKNPQAASMWFMQDGVFAGSDYMPGAIHPLFDFGAPHVLKVMKVGYNGSNNKDRIPGSILYGSVDGTTWTELYQIPTGSKYDITSWDCELPEAAAVRYVWFANPKQTANYSITELQLFAEGPAIALGRPVLWKQTARLDSPLPDAGVGISGTLRAGDGVARHLVAIAADTDYQDVYADWVAHAAKTVDFGTVEAGASFSGAFAGLPKGYWQWRVFAVADNAAVGVSEPGHPFHVGTKPFVAPVYVSSTRAAMAADGRFDDTTADGGNWIIFDLRSIPDGYRLAGMRFWTRLYNYQIRASNGALTLLTPKAEFDWSTYVTSVITNKNTGRVASIASGYPDSTKRVVGEFFTTSYTSAYADLGECPIAPDELTERPQLLFFQCDRLDVRELELRIAKIPQGFSVIVR